MKNITATPLQGDENVAVGVTSGREDDEEDGERELKRAKKKRSKRRKKESLHLAAAAAVTGEESAAAAAAADCGEGVKVKVEPIDPDFVQAFPPSAIPPPPSKRRRLNKAKEVWTTTGLPRTAAGRDDSFTTAEFV